MEEKVQYQGVLITPMPEYGVCALLLAFPAGPVPQVQDGEPILAVSGMSKSRETGCQGRATLPLPPVSHSFVLRGTVLLTLLCGSGGAWAFWKVPGAAPEGAQSDRDDMEATCTMPPRGSRHPHFHSLGNP